jgi:flavin-binding protein dodecin
MLADKPHRLNGRTSVQRVYALTILPPVTALTVRLPAQRAIAQRFRALARNGPTGPVWRFPFIGLDRKWLAEGQNDAFGSGEARLLIQINGQGGGEYPASCFHTEWEDDMPESVYDVILLIGSSKESWEKAAANAVEQASKSLRNLRVAEIVELDMQLDAKGKVEAYRAKVRLSFKVER